MPPPTTKSSPGELPDPKAGPRGRRVRDELALELTRSEYLPADIADAGPVRMLQASAPVFDARGQAVSTNMLFGPGCDLTAREIDALGTQVRAAADRATRNNSGRDGT